MKTPVTALAIIIMMAIYSCQPKAEPYPEMSVNHPNGIFDLTPSTQISKDTFNAWVDQWDTSYRTYMANDSLHYFDMPLVDLTTVISNQNVNKARIYMGMAYEPNGDMTPHAMIVGTVNGIADFSAIMDYTSVCPKLCPQ